MNFNKVWSKKILIFLISVIITIITSYSGYLFHYSEIIPDLAIAPLLGLMFGPYAVLGTCVGDLYINLSAGFSLSASLVEVFAIFLVSYIPYKLWYSSFIKTVTKKGIKTMELSVLRLNSVYNIIKFITIMFIDSLIYFVLYGLLYESFGAMEVISFENFIYTLNFFNFSLILGILLILFVGFSGISFYHPNSSNLSRNNNSKSDDVSVVGSGSDDVSVVGSGSDDVSVVGSGSDDVSVVGSGSDDVFEDESQSNMSKDKSKSKSKYLTPINNFINSIKKFRFNPKLANLFLILSISLAFVYALFNLFFDYTIDNVLIMFVIYLLCVLFLFKPFNHNIQEDDPNKVIIEGIRIKKFNTSLIEKIILIFMLIVLIGIFIVIFASYNNILTNIYGLGDALSLLVYMDLSFIIFLIPAIVFLWYIEKNITRPIEFISRVVKDYVSGNSISKTSAELISNYGNYMDQDTEIGNLSRALTKMTKDLEEYIDELKVLTSEKERFKTELAIAKKIQESFIPKNFDSVSEKGINIAGLMVPAKEVGGDFYDFFMVDDNHLAIVIGDVSDKGVPASLFMVVTKTLIQEYSYLIDDPDEIFNKVNNSLCKNNKENMFVTGWMGILDLDSGEFNFVNAGHEPPLLNSNYENKGYSWLKTKPGFVLGGFENINYKLNKIKLESGDRIILYTDGVTEANNSYSGFFGEEGLLNAISQNEDLSVSEELDFIKDEIYKFTGGTEQFDDITLLMMEYNKKD